MATVYEKFMVQCDNCNSYVTGGMLFHGEKIIEEQNRTINQKWCLDCVRGTLEERERREAKNK
jgi:hypothetical protein